MRKTAITGGVLGLIISLLAQLFAVVDDSYTFGNFGLLGIISGIVAIVGASLIKRRPVLASILLIITTVTGIYGLSVFYIIPGILTLITGIYLLFKRSNRQKTA
ncbi:hypothetical protein [Terribacillus saccharophilus]|uniref:DUF4064 domain-containing protein n=1 Tax=Terribacillus saccharophilus TaxID=361277 RepID=A0ABX4GUQ2_9BACI|nr:hypothetical protein [Terribacillus saccharophilus]PAD34245.1 hypothetical protein CHH56_15535 [Terribacillus saccharophilus]PAD94831.1 hypothetical protein CHH50_16625 [Terribacillus saccharophilus]PAD98580.1 hypothetical protein CHH48_16635 [Terribacillus saccharophilus]